MSRRAKIIVGILLGLSAVLALGTIGLTVYFMRHAAVTTLPKYNTVPDFQLTERSGQTVALGDLKGKVWLADFIYSTCPGPCPMISSHLAELQTSALQNPNVRFVSFSTNPAQDTPAILQTYAEGFHAGAQWLFLTGDQEKIFALIRTGFTLAVATQADAKNPIVHSTKLVLVDKNGVIRKYYDGLDHDENATILRDIQTLGNE